MTYTIQGDALIAKSVSPKKIPKPKTKKEFANRALTFSAQTEIDRSTFTRLLQNRNLWIKNIGPDSLETLEKLTRAPSKLVKEKNKKPCHLKCVGVLIKAGFARLNSQEQQYETTTAGRRWLKQVKAILKAYK